jgi:hypothetical protein
LKVKKRSLLIIVAVLSVLLFGIGTAHAVMGVNDDVPGQDIVFPVICGVNNTVDTAFAIADVVGTGTIFSHDYPNNKDYQTDLHLFVLEPGTSQEVKNLHFKFTPFDVLTGLCSTIIGQVDAAKKPQLIRNLCDSGGNCQDYYVAELRWVQDQNIMGGDKPSNRFVSWVTFDDLANGYASGFDGLSMELGVGGEMEENGSATKSSVAIAARRIFPRYVVAGDPTQVPQDHDWWILLFGRADISHMFPQSSWIGNRILYCLFYDEDENVASNSIPIPEQLNVIDVDPYVTGLFSSYAHNGFASCDIQEDGSNSGVGFHNFGTTDNDGLVESLLSDSSGYYSFAGWSHAKVEGQTAHASWDVIWPIHRTYCSPLMPVGTTVGKTSEGTYESCGCNGPSKGTPPDFVVPRAPGFQAGHGGCDNP